MQIVLLTVKSHETESVLAPAAAYLGNAIVVAIQIGMNQAVIERYVPVRRLLLGIATANTAIEEPGVSRLLRRGGFCGRPLFARNPPASLSDAVVRLLCKSSLAATAERNIIGAQYNKLIMNSMGYASVLSASELHREAMLHRPWRRAVALPILEEGLRVVKQSGITLRRIPDSADVLRVQRLLKIMDKTLMERIARAVITRSRSPKKVVYSIYHDVVRGQPTEAGRVNGKIVQRARHCQGRSPCNELVVQAVRELADVIPAFGRGRAAARLPPLGSKKGGR